MVAASAPQLRKRSPCRCQSGVEESDLVVGVTSQFGNLRVTGVAGRGDGHPPYVDGRPHDVLHVAADARGYRSDRLEAKHAIEVGSGPFEATAEAGQLGDGRPEVDGRAYRVGGAVDRLPEGSPYPPRG